MKLLQVVTSPQLRGAEVFALDLSRALEARGVETAIVYLYAAEDEARLPLRPQDRCLEGRKDHPAERVPGFQPGLLARVVRRIRELRPDVVQTGGSRSVKYAALARRLQPRAPWRLVYRAIGDPRAWRPPGLRTALFERSILSAFDGFVAVSRQALSGLHTGGRPVEQIPRGVDLERLAVEPDRIGIRRRMGAGAETPVMLYVGRLSAEKRLDRLVRVAERAAGQVPGAELWVVGDGPLRAHVEAARDDGAGPLRIRVLGIREDVPDLMAASDLLLLTSDTEGIPGVVLEAAAVGLPAVATRVGGVPECVVHGETGFLAPPDDEAALAEAAESLLGDSVLRRRMGAAARLRIAEEFSVRTVAERYLSFYRALLERSRN